MLTRAQHIALSRIALQGREYVGGEGVQIHQNLAKKGYARLLDAAGKRVTESWKALWIEITKKGCRVLEAASKRSPRQPWSSLTKDEIFAARRTRAILEERVRRSSRKKKRVT